MPKERVEGIDGLLMKHSDDGKYQKGCVLL